MAGGDPPHELDRCADQHRGGEGDQERQLGVALDCFAACVADHRVTAAHAAAPTVSNAANRRQGGSRPRAHGNRGTPAGNEAADDQHLPPFRSSVRAA